LIILQAVVHVLLSSLLSNDGLQPMGSRARTLELLHDYYDNHILLLRRHNSHNNTSSSSPDILEDVAPAGIIVDDNDYNKNDNADDDDSDTDDLHELEDHLADQTEENLNRAEQQQQQQQQQQQEKEREMSVAGEKKSFNISFIDNYYSRQVEKQNQIQQLIQDSGSGTPPFPFLIVGGSDGSGTRAFVTALGKLGVPMLVDDKGTMDVHGKELFQGEGWPPLAQLILNHTHTANYEVEDLPKDVRDTIVTELTKFKNAMIRRGHKHDKREKERIEKKNAHVNHYNNSHHKKNKNKKERLYPATAFHLPKQQRSLLEMDSGEDMEEKPSNEDIENAAFIRAPFDVRPDQIIMDSPKRSTMIQYGWKAPVSMLLIPFLREVFGPIKFLHVVRDGRDIALSTNQSPVRKFYISHYGQDSVSRDVSEKIGTSDSNNTDFLAPFAMQLWNDWNLQVLGYQKKHANDANFDYLIMHTEDLLNPETKFQSLQQLAHFVGSPKTLADLCCQSQQAVVDMGMSSPVMGNGGPKRHHRHQYDNWFHRDDHSRQTKEQRYDKDVADFQRMVHDMTKQNSSTVHGHLRHANHGVMGGDPILDNVKHGGIQDNDDDNHEKEAQEDTSSGLFDYETGRHSNWHHGHMEAGSIVANARAKHADDVKHRNDRFKGLQEQVSVHKQRVWKQGAHHTGQQQDLQQVTRSDFKHQITANHQARKQHSLDHSKQDRETMDFLMNHDHETRQEAFHKRQLADRAPGRRLMSAFHKLGYRPKMKHSAAQKEDGSMPPQTHRQFKPKRIEGEKVFQERTGGDSQPSNQPPANTAVSGGWSMASISEALGLSSPYSKHSLVALPASNANGNTKTAFDHAIQEQFENMPLLPIHSRRPPALVEHDRNRNRKKEGVKVKARYGKWLGYLSERPELSKQLHELGKQSLEAFGYEPPAQFMDASGADHDFQCDSTVVCHKGREPSIVIT